MEAILDFAYNAMSGISENFMVDTKVMNLLIFYRKLYQLVKTAAILDFYVLHRHF